MNWLQHLFHLRPHPRPLLDSIDSDKMQLAEIYHENASQTLIDTLRCAVDHSSEAIEHHGRNLARGEPP